MASSKHSSRQSHSGWEWGFQSVDRSLKATEDESGCRVDMTAVLFSSSNCRSPKSQRPKLSVRLITRPFISLSAIRLYGLAYAETIRLVIGPAYCCLSVARQSHKEAPVPKIITVALATLFISASPAAFAQTTGAVGPAQDRMADWKAFTDTRIDLVKLALQMTPAQEKLWPSVEEAIRARANSRYARLTTLAARQEDNHERSPVEVLRARADALSQRSTNLRKL